MTVTIKSSKSSTSGAIRSFALGAVTALGTLFSINIACGSQDMLVSQKNRQFDPGIISVTRGQAVKIVNDDSDLLHHVYIESETFNFDSGDQQPGDSARIIFSVAGEFKVLCGIHPKMKLLVRVGN